MMFPMVMVCRGVGVSWCGVDAVFDGCCGCVIGMMVVSVGGGSGGGSCLGMHSIGCDCISICARNRQLFECSGRFPLFLGASWTF